MHKNILTSNPSNHMPPFQILEDGSLGDLLMVVDMQNVYLEDQPWGCIETTKVIQDIRSLIDQKIPDNILFTQFLPPQHPIGTWKQYNHKNQEINDTPWMSEIIADLAPYCSQYPLFSKEKYSSYSNPKVASAAAKARRVVLCGVMTECCVLFTLLSGIDAGNKIIYLTDACSGTCKEHQQFVECLAANYAPVHTEVMTCQDYINSRIEAKTSRRTDFPLLIT